MARQGWSSLSDAFTTRRDAHASDRKRRRRRSLDDPGRAVPVGVYPASAATDVELKLVGQSCKAGREIELERSAAVDLPERLLGRRFACGRKGGRAAAALCALQPDVEAPAPRLDQLAGRLGHNDSHSPNDRTAGRCWGAPTRPCCVAALARYGWSVTAAHTRVGGLTVLAGAGLAVLGLGASATVANRPTAPVIVGNKTPQAGTRSVYVFSSVEKGVASSKMRYRCSLDSPRLHACPRRLTVTPTVGTHVLRVQAIDPARHRSRVSRVAIVAQQPIPELQLTQVWQVHVDENAQGHNFFDVAVGPTGRVYVADSAADRVDVYQPDGSLAFRFGSHGTGPGQFSFTSADNVGLGGVGIDPGTGRVYVADSGNQRIETFTPDGVFLGQWGMDTLDEVLDVAIRQDGAVFTIEDRPDSIKQFTAGGVLVKTLTVHPVDSGGIAFGGDGRLLVADYGSGAFLALDGSGGLEQRVQISASSKPSGIAGDTTGSTYVTDSNNARVDVFDSTGEQVGFFPTVEHPTGIALGADALYVTGYDGTLTAYRRP